MIESFLGILRVGSKFMIWLSFCPPDVSSRATILGPGIGYKAGICPHLQLAFTFLRQAGWKRDHGQVHDCLQYIYFSGRRVSSTTSVTCRIYSLVCFWDYSAAELQHESNRACNYSADDSVSTIVGCIAVYGTVIPWYQFYLNDQTYEWNTRHHKKPAISGGFWYFNKEMDQRRFGQESLSIFKLDQRS